MRKLVDLSGLTKRQAEVLKSVFAYWSKHGLPPTVRDLMLKLSIKNPNAVKTHLVRLQELGRLKLVPRESRGIRLVGVKWIPEAV